MWMIFSRRDTLSCFSLTVSRDPGSSRTVMFFTPGRGCLRSRRRTSIVGSLRDEDFRGHRRCGRHRDWFDKERVSSRGPACSTNRRRRSETRAQKPRPPPPTPRHSRNDRDDRRDVPKRSPYKKLYHVRVRAGTRPLEEGRSKRDVDHIK